MDKWRSRPKSQASFVVGGGGGADDALLAPSLRPRNRPAPHQQRQLPTSNDHRQRRTVNGLFNGDPAVPEPQASSSGGSSASSSLDNWSADKHAGATLKAKDSWRGAPRPADSRNGKQQSRSGRVKARVEARRVEQLRGDSSLDESGLEPERPAPANKRSRASRTERYLKRVCGGGGGGGGRNGPRRGPGDDPRARPQHDITDDNFYARHTQVGVSPLVRQTLRYFSEFERGCGRRRPPTPPHRDHTSRVQLDKYQRLARSPEPEPPPPPLPHRCRPADDQLRPSLVSSPPRQMHATAHPQQRSPLPTSATPDKPQRRGSSNLEEALCELEAIYNSLQLGNDEELLDRADRRTMEEFLYKGFTCSPDAVDADSRRKTWLADHSVAEQPDRLKDDMAYRRMHPKERPTSADAQSMSGISYLMTSPIPCQRRDTPPPFIDPNAPSRARRREPDVTLDDVVFRNMNYANSTLKVVEPQPPFGIPLGPITAAADSDYLHSNPMDSERARSPYLPCREPDLITDDLAFRNLRKDTQPSSRQSSPCFLPSTPSRSPLPLPLPLPMPRPTQRATRAAGSRSSVNLYGSISKPTSPMEPVDGDDLLSARTDSTALGDYCREVSRRPAQRFASRRTSEPEAMPVDWQSSSWRALQTTAAHRHRQRHHRRTDRYSDADPSSGRSSSSLCDESSDEDIRPVCFRESPLVGDDTRDHEPAVSVGASSSLSSVSAINLPSPPPLPTRSLEPFTEHELSVYKQLCRDLENLVQLTRSSAGSDPVVEKSDCPIVPAEGPAVSSSAATESMAKVSVENVPVVEASQSLTAEISPMEREISTLLDSLKSLREDPQPEVAGTVRGAAPWQRVDEATLPAASGKKQDKLSSSSVETTKEEGGGGGGGGKDSSADEDEEKKDRVDEKLFLRSAQLGKLSGDWKESTPKGVAADRRRTSLASEDNRHWEGVNKCNHKYNSMPAKTSSLLMFRQYGSKRKSKNRKSICTIS